MLNRIFVVDSVTLSSTGTAVSSYVPFDQTTRKLPTQVVVKATGQGAYVRLSNDNSAATNVDVLVQGGDHVVLSVQGRRWVSVLSDGASSTVSVGALSTGVSGDAASLNLDFAGTGTLDSRVTFTRASTATYFSSVGVLTSASTNTPRFDYNPSTLAAQGLLIEESRANLMLRSQEIATGPWFNAGLTSITNNTTDVVAPDGLNTATKIVATGSGSAVGQGATLTAAVHTGSIWLRTLSGTATLNLIVYLAASPFTNIGTTSVTVTSSWQRFTVVTSAATAASYNLQLNTISANTIYAWGAQLEAGAFPTSYIPTTTTALTRAADVASVNTLAPWYNATEGTLFAQASVISASYNQGVLADIGAVGAFGTTEYLNWNGSGWTLSPNTAPINVTSVVTTSSTAKMAAAIKANDSVISANGLIGVVDTACAVPSAPNALNIGRAGWSAGSNFFNGWIQRVAYYPRRLSNAELQAITA